MYLSRICFASVLTNVLWIGGALAGERLEAHRIKTCTPDGVCVPNRPEYGYYKTQWRRWPGTEFTEVDKIDKPAKQPESLPQPHTATGQDTFPSGDLPTDAMDDDLPLPGEDSDTMPAPPRDSGPIDTQPALPGDLQRTVPQQPADQDFRKLFPDDEEDTKPAVPKSPNTTESEEDSKPEMPTDLDDPFKDEPLPGDPNNESGQRMLPKGPPHQRAENIRWRNAPALAVKSAIRDTESPEPRLLQSTAAGRPTVRKSPSTSAINPLRAASMTVKPKAQRPKSVVPTAEWSAQAEDSGAAKLSRNNPLRSR